MMTNFLVRFDTLLKVIMTFIFIFGVLFLFAKQVGIRSDHFAYGSLLVSSLELLLFQKFFLKKSQESFL